MDFLIIISFSIFSPIIIFFIKKDQIKTYSKILFIYECISIFLFHIVTVAHRLEKKFAGIAWAFFFIFGLIALVLSILTMKFVKKETIALILLSATTLSILLSNFIGLAIIFTPDAVRSFMKWLIK